MLLEMLEILEILEIMKMLEMLVVKLSISSKTCMYQYHPQHNVFPYPVCTGGISGRCSYSKVFGA